MYSHARIRTLDRRLFCLVATLLATQFYFPANAGPSLDDEVSVSAGEESFFDRDRPPAGRADATRLSTRIRVRNDSRPIGGYLDVGGSFDTAVEKQTSYEVPEAYVSWMKRDRADAPEPSENEASGSSIKVYAGRKREAWSQLDTYWTLGIVEPLNRFDSLRPTEQGLSGLFGQFTWSHIQLVLFGSPVFIPEQGPNYELNDGQFSTSNAWFSEPTNHVKLISQSTTLKYQINTPTVGSVITHASGGFILRAGDLVGPGWLFQVGYAKKPRNQLSLPFTGVLVTDANNPFASITLSPQVAYHNIATTEMNYKTETLDLGLSFLADISDPEPIPTGLVWQTFDPEFLLSPNLQFRLNKSDRFTSLVRFSSLTTFGGDAHLVTSSDLTVAQNPFGARLMYRQAASFELRGKYAESHGWIIDSGIRWIEEYSEQGTVVMSDVRFIAPRNWQFGLYVDLLGSRLPENENPGFISKFRDNDRVGGKLTYIF